MTKVLLIALLILLMIRLLTQGNRNARAKADSRSGGRKRYQEGEIVVEKKGSEEGRVEDVDFEEVKE